MVLLDTCALIWSVNGDPLSREAVRLMARAGSTGALYLSPVSAWEIGVLVSRGRLSLEVPAEAYIAQAFNQPGIRVAELTPEIAVRASSLPGQLHEDPADRLLVSTAIVMGLRFMTRDRRILDYGAAGYLPVVRC